MKLVIAIIRVADDPAVVRALVGKGYRVTRIASSGAFARRRNVTLLVGVDEHRVQEAIEVFRQACSPARSGEHGVTLFVVDAPEFQQV
jgi:uncharacterized protein YaaQ